MEDREGKAEAEAEDEDEGMAVMVPRAVVFGVWSGIREYEVVMKD
jgi:hypothetical protein